uniref:Uncharacterized protein n=1 Tax=Arundo donax TaxID=35708 RepID=A0A0A9FU74_ARUDO
MPCGIRQNRCTAPWGRAVVGGLGTQVEQGTKAELGGQRWWGIDVGRSGGGTTSGPELGVE